MYAGYETLSGGVQTNYTKFPHEKQPKIAMREARHVGLRKAEVFALVLTLLFAALTLGFHWGRSRTPAQFSVHTVTSAPNAPAPGAGQSAARTEDAVNLNTADLEELCSLRGIGEVLAQRIIDYREANGPFAQVEDVTKVSGIGSGIFEQLREHITVD